MPTGRGRHRRSTHARVDAAEPAVVRGAGRHLRPRPRRRRRADAVGRRARPPQPAADRRACSGNTAIADVLPLTPLQQGLLFHAAQRRASDDLYAVQLDITVAGRARPAPAARRGARRWSPGIRNLAARFLRQFDEPVQVIPADPEAGWRLRRTSAPTMTERDPAAVRRRTRRRLRPGRPAGVPGRADPRRTGSAPVGADQSPHRGRRLVDADPAGGDLRRLPRAAACPRQGPYRNFVTWLAERDLDAARAAWGEALRRLRHPHPGRPQGPAVASDGEASSRSGSPPRPPGPSANWPVRTTPPSTPCCRARGRSC